MKKTILLSLLALSFSTAIASAESCKVIRTDVFSRVSDPTLPSGSSLGTGYGQTLILKEDEIAVTAVGGSQSGYLFLSPNHKDSHLLSVDPAQMYDYGPKELNDGRIVIGSKMGELQYLDHRGNLLGKFMVAPNEHVYVGLVEKDDSLLVIAPMSGVLYRVSPQGIIMKLLTQKEFSESFTTVQEYSDGHLSLNFLDTDSDISLELLTHDGKLDFIVPNDEFFPNTFQPTSEVAPGIVAIPGNHWVTGNNKAQASIAYVNLATKQTTLSDFGNGKLIFFQKLNPTDFAIIFSTNDGKETIQYFHGTEKAWERVQPDALNDAGFQFAQLSDATLVLPQAQKIQFFSPKGNLKAEFSFKGLDTDPTSHQDQNPMSPIHVLSDDTVMVSQWYFQGLRFSYLKLICQQSEF